MEVEKNKIENEKFQRDLKYSLVFHVIVLGAFSVKNIFFSSPDIDYKSAIRVDIVDLPDKIVNKANTQKKTPAKKIEPIKQIKPKDKPKPKPKPKKKSMTNKVSLKKSQNTAIERLKALEKLKQEKDTEDTQQAALNKIKEFKGNNLSKGSSLSGVVADQQNAYIGLLDNHIKQYWDLPRWLAEENLSCKVQIKIDTNGNLVFRRILESSGNTDFDDIALKTVDNASPFPMPPAGLSGTLETNGVTIEFEKMEE